MVYKHLSPVEFELYQQGQARFYEQVLALWQIPQEKCSPKELGNLILSVVLIYNSAARSLPFFLPEELEQTAKPRQPPYPVIWPLWPMRTNDNKQRTI